MHMRCDGAMGATGVVCVCMSGMCMTMLMYDTTMTMCDDDCARDDDALYVWVGCDMYAYVLMRCCAYVRM